ncbi:FkbM family methyltransferase [Candidatus Viadribacter manganicus]|uniref:Methyltransferase FkbM domain-containing protein n=1 Tax=Candidatus Viadribacter manganicus TaxID=1759059 RepID=A0A1B1AJS8_9PROT|nr:FkbM family methyltransferase [Candidatus Viadribacter manganicus]ANP46818.1 hypothetical protein ATE48_13295 [Candidatus Viadribacter manganicus]
MAAPDATPPKTSPLRQVFRTLPQPVRAALRAIALVPIRLPGVLYRQTRRAGWRIAESMSPPRQPGLFFWQMKRAPGRLFNMLRHARWEMQPSARHAGWQMKRSARIASQRRWRLPRLIFGRHHTLDVPDQPSFPHALARMQQHDLAIRSIINIGAGSGDDSEYVQRAWPNSRTLLIEMDGRFEEGYHQLKTELPNLAWAICAAGPHDDLGRMQKSDIGGVGGAIDLEEKSEAGAPVQFKRIDTLVREHALPGPFFLRFDTHGFELDVLAGATETLKNTALIMMEVYNFKLRFTGNKNLTFDEMSLHMKSLGFRCVDICDTLHRPGDLALWQMHLFFIRDDHPLWTDSSYSKPGLR